MRLLLSCISIVFPSDPSVNKQTRQRVESFQACCGSQHDALLCAAKKQVTQGIQDVLKWKAACSGSIDEMARISSLDVLSELPHSFGLRYQATNRNFYFVNACKPPPLLLLAY
jgi:hypothetical protein